MGYPVGMRWPSSASNLLLRHTWRAIEYEDWEKRNTRDTSAVETNVITRTLLYRLIAAFLVGTDLNGETTRMRFEPFKYGEF